MKLLALDLASKTGAAIIDMTTGQLEHAAVWTIPAKNGFMYGPRFEHLMSRVRGTVAAHNVQAIVVENLGLGQARNTNTARLLFGMAAVVELWAWGNSVQWMEPVGASTVKAHAAKMTHGGKGKRSKEDTMTLGRQLVRNWLGREDVADDNEADAVSLAHYAWHTWGQRGD